VHNGDLPKTRCEYKTRGWWDTRKKIKGKDQFGGQQRVLAGEGYSAAGKARRPWVGTGREGGNREQVREKKDSIRWRPVIRNGDVKWTPGKLNQNLPGGKRQNNQWRVGKGDRCTTEMLAG